MVSESSHIKSGFGNYTREILNRLYDTNKYEIAELSCYRTPETPKTEKWKVYPVAVSANDPLYNEYNSSPTNQYGQWRFEFALLDFKPHIVFDVRDFWNYTFEEVSPLRDYYHWIINPTYDSDPQKIDSINTLKNADTVLFHTHWAKNNLITQYNYNSNNLGPIASDAVDSTVFKPMGFNKKFHKVQSGLPADSVIIGTVMRNQKRKLIPDLINIFAKLCENNKDKKLFLYLHTSFPDALCWDIPALLLENNISNNVLFTYKCKSCGHFITSVYKGIKKICNKCYKKEAYLWSPSNALDDDSLNKIYNLFDIYVQYAICEGFGIPPIEAASAGIPVVTVDYGAMGEIGRNIDAKLVNVQRVFREQETNANRCYPDNSQCLNILQELILLPFEKLNNIGKNTRQKLLSSYSWDSTAKVYQEVFDSINIEDKKSWDAPTSEVNLNYTVINFKDNRDFIYDIVDNIIKDHKLKSTTFIEDLIRSLDEELVMNGLKMHHFKRTDAIKLLEVYANNKQAIETIRVNKSFNQIPKLQAFFDYSKK